MASNWLDVLFVAVTAAALVFGLIRGLIREVVGILSVLAGFLLAAHYYPNLSVILFSVVGHRPASDFLSFGAVFLAVVLAGGLLSRFISRNMAGMSRVFNHLLGGALGFLKGAFLCGVIALGFLVFPADSDIVSKSRLAPPALRVTSGLIKMAPEDLKKKFSEAYKKVKEIKRGGGDGQKI
ncbi:MAG: CvpA family protein [Candidatus Aminicenantes bacterium]|nr:CvpA family protein [Candidatus Aminicenantes bacterium]